MTEQNFEKLESIKTDVDLPALIYVVDEMALLNFVTRTDFVKANVINENIKSLSRFGRTAHIHLILSSQLAEPSLFPESLKCNISQRFLCGKTNDYNSRSIINSEIGELLPDFPGSYLSYCKGKTQLFQGYFVPEEINQNWVVRKIVDQQKQKNSTKQIYMDRFKEASSLLEWNQVPVGIFAYDIPYVWQMDKSPHCIIYGQTGSGKTLLINIMISHFINKENVKLFLTDLKGVEFNSFAKADAVDSIATNLDEAANMAEYLVKQITIRNDLMRSEQIKNIPVDGKLKLKNNICINNQFIPNNTIISYKLKDNDGVYEGKAGDLLKIQDKISLISLPENDNDEKIQEEETFGW